MHTLKGLKNIEDIVPGDIVLTRPETADETFTEAIYKPVLNTFVTRPDMLLHLGFMSDTKDMETISTTTAHRFYVIDKGWRLAEQLVAGDVCSLPNGYTATLTSIAEECSQGDESFTTYNFEVEEHHTYFVGKLGIWVHNSGTYCDELVEFAIDLKKKNPHLQDHELIDIVFKKIKLDVKNRSTSDNIEDITKHFNDFKAMHFKYKYGPSRTSNFNDFTSHLRRINGGTDALGKDYPGSLMPGAKAPTHAHHIVMKGKNFPGVQESIEILERYDIDWYKGVENLVWAPNTGHTKEYAWKVYLALKEADNGGKGTRQKIIDTLKDLGEEFVKEHTSF